VSAPRKRRGTSGQATVEYLIVGLVLVVIIVALGLLARALEDGLFVEHAAQGASHAITGNMAGSVGDVLLY
jgi:Flp pilus assembly pilin Flp